MLLNCSDNLLSFNALELTGVDIPYDDSNNNQFLNISVVAMECSIYKDENINNISSIIEDIMANNPETRLIVFGETILGWYYYKNDPETYQHSIAEEVPGNFTNLISSLCMEYDIYITFGLSEKRLGNLYNTQLIIDPSGSIIGSYTKNLLLPWDEESGFISEQNCKIVEIDGFIAGLRICADYDNKWLTEQFINHNVDLIINSNATMEPSFNFDPSSRRVNAWNIMANRAGMEGNYFYNGFITISDPMGNIITGGDGNQRYINYSIGIEK